MVEGVSDAIKIPDGGGGVGWGGGCFSSQVEKRGGNYIRLGVFSTVKEMCYQCVMLLLSKS